MKDFRVQNTDHFKTDNTVLALLFKAPKFLKMQGAPLITFQNHATRQTNAPSRSQLPWNLHK